MAKVSAVEKNNKRKRLVARYADKRSMLKALAKDPKATVEEHFAARLKLAEMPRNSAPVRVRNRCLMSGRPRGYYRKLKISRIALRDLASSGQIPGMIKASW